MREGAAVNGWKAFPRSYERCREARGQGGLPGVAPTFFRDRMSLPDRAELMHAGSLQDGLGVPISLFARCPGCLRRQGGCGHP